MLPCVDKSRNLPNCETQIGAVLRVAWVPSHLAFGRRVRTGRMWTLRTGHMIRSSSWLETTLGKWSYSRFPSPSPSHCATLTEDTAAMLPTFSSFKMTHGLSHVEGRIQVSFSGSFANFFGTKILLVQLSLPTNAEPIIITNVESKYYVQCTLW